MNIFKNTLNFFKSLPGPELFSQSYAGYEGIPVVDLRTALDDKIHESTYASIITHHKDGVQINALAKRGLNEYDIKLRMVSLDVTGPVLGIEKNHLLMLHHHRPLKDMTEVKIAVKVPVKEVGLFEGVRGLPSRVLDTIIKDNLNDLQLHCFYLTNPNQTPQFRAALKAKSAPERDLLQAR